MEKTMLGILRESVQSRLKYSTMRINIEIDSIEKYIQYGNYKAVLDHLGVLSGKIEKLCKELREETAMFHDRLRALGHSPKYRAYLPALNVNISYENDIISIKMPEMLPYPTNGSVYFIHEQVDSAFEQFMREKSWPLHRKRTAVVFLHHYAADKSSIRQLRDYDNVERRCITNVIARHLLWSDNPNCIISMDILAPGDHNFTEVKVMPIPIFQQFVMSEKLTFNLP